MSIRRSLLTFGMIVMTVAAAATTPPIVSIVGQYMTVDGVVAEEGAILKVVGPDGYRFVQNIARGESETIDLQASLQVTEGGALALPSGTYHYELVSRPGGQVVSGSFSIGLLLEAMGGADPQSVGSGPQEAVTTHEDAIAIHDTLDDGITALDLDSDDPTLDQHWTIVNETGVLKFKQHELNDNNEAGIGTTNFALTRGGGTNAAVGIGTEFPFSSLDIQTAAPIINMTDTDGGSNWKLINGGGDFILQSDCDSDCDLFERWNVVIVEEGSQEDSLVIDSTGVSLSSSRAVKKNLEPAASTALLDELAQLPIYTWSYARDNTETVHVGPMAEDFHARFGFGNDPTRLSPVDTGGLALAAIQGLQHEVEERDRKLEAMERRLHELEQHLTQEPKKKRARKR